MPPAQNMEMKMKHALATMRTGVDDDAVAGVGNPLLFCDLVASQHQTPEDMPAADWEHKRNTELGHAYWIAGVIQGEKTLYADSNTNLRSAIRG